MPLTATAALHHRRPGQRHLLLQEHVCAPGDHCNGRRQRWRVHLKGQQQRRRRRLRQPQQLADLSDPVWAPEPDRLPE